MTTGTNDDLLFHYGIGNFPDAVYRFSVPRAGIRRWDDSTLVYDVRLPGNDGAALRHYAFYDRWFVVNVSRNYDGELVAEEGHGIAWCFNCDVTTPLFSVGQDACYTVDLELDLLAAPDGARYVVKDEDEFAASVAAGYISAEEEAGAQRGLEELRALCAAPGGLLEFVNNICPLDAGGPPGGLPLQPPVAFPALAGVPLLHAFARRARYGDRDASFETEMNP